MIKNRVKPLKKKPFLDGERNEELMFTKLTYMKRAIILFLLISFCGGATDSSPPQQQEQQSQESSSENSSQESNQQNASEQSSSSSNQESSSQSQSSGLTLQTLPDIKEFMTNKTDRFFVDQFKVKLIGL